MESDNLNNITDLTYLIHISNGDNDFIEEMISVYIEQTTELISNMETHLKSKNWKLLRAVAHKMKGSFSFFNMKDLHAMVNSIENYANKEINLDLLPEMVAKVKLECEISIVELKQKKAALKFI